MPPVNVPKQHGVNGVYLGGDWVEIEECAEKFNIKNGSHEDCLNKGQCKTCPRSRSKHIAVKSDGSYDVVIIGAGCIGASIARELSKSKLSVLVLESADDITQGATKVSLVILILILSPTINQYFHSFLHRSIYPFILLFITYSFNICLCILSYFWYDMIREILVSSMQVLTILQIPIVLNFAGLEIKCLLI